MSKDAAEGPEKVGDVSLINAEWSGGPSQLRCHFTEKSILGTQMNGGFVPSEKGLTN